MKSGFILNALSTLCWIGTLIFNCLSLIRFYINGQMWVPYIVLVSINAFLVFLYGTLAILAYRDKKP